MFKKFIFKHIYLLLIVVYEYICNGIRKQCKERELFMNKFLFFPILYLFLLGTYRSIKRYNNILDNYIHKLAV